MKVWLASSDVAGHAMVQALQPVLRDLLPACAFDCADPHPDAAPGPQRGDGALLCVTTAALLGETLYRDLGRLQGAVGAAGFVAPLLLDLSPEDLAHTPLSIFQCTRTEFDDLTSLVADLALRAPPPAGAPGSLDHHWPALEAQLGGIPGVAARPFIVTLVLPQRQVTFGYDASQFDPTWRDGLGAILDSLPSSPIKPPPFDPSELVALDAEGGRWIARPGRTSRVTTPHLVLASPAAVDAAQGDARAIARGAREQVSRYRTLGGQPVLPWKFLQTATQIMMLSNAR